MLDVMASVRAGAPDRAHYMRDMDSNVDAMKAWLIDRVGKDWAEATRYNTQSNLEIGCGTPPWKEMQDAMSQPGIRIRSLRLLLVMYVTLLTHSIAFCKIKLL